MIKKFENSDNKVITLMLRNNFNEPVDIEKLPDADVIEFARESNKSVLKNYVKGIISINKLVEV